MTILIFQDGKLKREYSSEEFEELVKVKAKIQSNPGEWAYWVNMRTWFIARPNQQGYSCIDSLDQVPKEYRAIVMLYQ